MSKNFNEYLEHIQMDSFFRVVNEQKNLDPLDKQSYLMLKWRLTIQPPKIFKRYMLSLSIRSPRDDCRSPTGK